MNNQEITHLVYEIFERYEFDQKEVIGTMRREIEEDWLPPIKGIKQRMDEIESMIHAHSVGVQNVYAKLEKIEKTLELKDIKKLVRYIESYDSQRIKKEIEEIHKYMNSDHVNKAIEEFNEFKYHLFDLLEIDLGRHKIYR